MKVVVQKHPPKGTPIWPARLQSNYYLELSQIRISVCSEVHINIRRSALTFRGSG